MTRALPLLLTSLAIVGLAPAGDASASAPPLSLVSPALPVSLAPPAEATFGAAPTNDRSPAPARTPDLAELQRAIDDRVRTGWSTGIVAGVLYPDGHTRILTAGHNAAGTHLDGRSGFEVGSITKTYTALLLADMVHRGEVQLDTTVASLLPAGIAMPASSRPITLKDLATHTSGLVRDATNLEPDDLRVPFGGYDTAHLYAFLGSTQLTHEPGAAWEYSNVGYGLLGHVLARRAGKPYEALLQERVLRPLGLKDTGITLRAAAQRRMLLGHDGDGRVVPPWTGGELDPAGSIRSNAHDLLAYAKAALEPAATGPLAPAFAATQAVQWSGPLVGGDEGDVMGIGLAWIHEPVGGRDLIWHNGGTAGFGTFIGLDPSRQTAVVVLSDRSAGGTDIGFHALDPSVELAKLPVPIKLPAAALDRFAGTYDLDGAAVEITRMGGRLEVHMDGLADFGLYPADKTTFFARGNNVQVTFQRDASGRVTGFEALVDGVKQTGTRVG